VVSYSVSQRLRELGVRLALGARGKQIVALVVGQGMRPVVAGIVLGVAGAFAATRVMGSLVYGVSTNDPLVFALVVAGLGAVAILACLAPAMRALRVDPVVVLRDE
jgi:ABC-type antimicrobial peptide transport system permease subunit